MDTSATEAAARVTGFKDEYIALAEEQAAKDRELLATLQARPKAVVDELRLSLGSAVIQQPNRATRRAMAKAARRTPRWR